MMEEQLGFHLGGHNSEYVNVRLTGRSEWSDSVEGWSSVEITIHAGCFRAVYPACFGLEDFAPFLKELRAVWQTLAGVAVFKPPEQQLVLKVVGNRRGSVEVEGEAWDMSAQNRLRFRLSLDQTYLEATVRQLEATVSRMSSHTKSAG